MSKQLNNYLPVLQCPCITVHVDSLEMLQSIQDRFVCATIDTDYELILDCIRIEEAQDRNDLRKLLKVDKETELPTDGYIVFWR